ncbi:MAG TPA: hypothetical protein VGR98_24240 [Streptosporangiaceae bacterium]|nr:hypothetical protein [Streptosporangiaceae bacterium]
MLIQQVQLVRVVLGARIARLAEARRSRDVGASAIELAIITAILVGLAALVLGIIIPIVTNRSTEIQTNNGKIP